MPAKDDAVVSLPPDPLPLAPLPGTLLIVLIVAVACGEDAATPTPQPTATPQAVLPPEEIWSLVSEAVRSAIPPPSEGVSAAEVEKIVRAAIPPTPTPAPTQDPKAFLQAARAGGHIPQLSVAAAAVWDPHEGGSLPSATAYIGPLYNKLIQFNPETEDKSDIRGDLAKDWQVSNDGKTYTFTLHENVNC